MRVLDNLYIIHYMNTVEYIRKRIGWSRQELADHLDVSYDTIYKWERKSQKEENKRRPGRTSVPKLVKLAKKHGIEIDPALFYPEILD